LFTIVNISGLAIGLASLLLVALFIYDEYSFDRYHKNAERIYRIVTEFRDEENIVNWARTSAPIAQYLSGVYPEIEHVARVRKNPGTDLLSKDELKFYEELLFFADSSLFNVFDFQLIKGNPSVALKDKNSIVITEALGKKYFHGDNPMGKTLRLHNSIDLKITGIMEPMPGNSHFVADAFVTFSTLDNILGEDRLTHWGWMDHYTYVLLANGSDSKELNKKLQEFLKKNGPEWITEIAKLFLQPLTSIHLHSELKDEITPNSRESYSYILGTIALFILLMACANFINLSTATLVSRLKEISIQKVFGASRVHLTLYFWIESILTCSIALILAMIIASIAIPYFNLATGKLVSIGNSQWMIFPATILTLLIGLMSGLIPTIQVGKLKVLRITKYNSSMMSKTGIRTALITFQFCISILLITATWIVSKQIIFLKSFRFGFTSERVIVIPIKDRSQNEKHKIIANQISQIPGIENVSFSSSMPACNNAYTYGYSFAGIGTGEQAMAVFLVDQNFFDVYGISLKEGRLPDPESRDTVADVIVNTAAIDQFHLTQPMGQLVTGQVNGRIVGIVENFNYESLHSSVKPIIMYSYPPNFRFVSVKLAEGEVQEKLKWLEEIWQKTYPGYPLEYFFLEDKVAELYSAEFQLGAAYTSFSLVAIVISGIGLIGLTTYLMTKKLKEISIRKVFGSSTLRLVGWIYSSYFKVIVIATLIAWGLAYYWMNKWLEGFAFRTELKFSHFIYPAITMVFILLLTTLAQTIKASRTNPVDYLRDE
jgi:putative ABC transport system permease protein